MHLKIIYLFFLCVWICGWVCEDERRYTQKPEALTSAVAGVTDGCDLPNVGAGNLTQASARAVCTAEPLFPAPQNYCYLISSTKDSQSVLHIVKSCCKSLTGK